MYIAKMAGMSHSILNDDLLNKVSWLELHHVLNYKAQYRNHNVWLNPKY